MGVGPLRLCVVSRGTCIAHPSFRTRIVGIVPSQQRWGTRASADTANLARIRARSVLRVRSQTASVRALIEDLRGQSAETRIAAAQVLQEFGPRAATAIESLTVALGDGLPGCFHSCLAMDILVAVSRGT